MSQSSGEALPYSSKSTFLAHGMENVTLHIALDCSICREPLAVTREAEDHTQSRLPAQAILSVGHTSVDAEVADEMEVCGNDSATETFPDDIPEPEQAVRVTPCNHTFGRTCLEAWFNISKSNRCPECNQELFPLRYLKLFLRQPTRTMRLEFANYIEQVCGDCETAAQIRANPMNDLNRLLIREFAMELWRREGFDVEYEYIDDADTDDEEADTEVDTEDEDEDEDEGESHEMDTTRRGFDNRPTTEHGFVKKA